MIHFNRSLLQNILSQPSAPFREKHVVDLLQRTLSAGGVPHFSDPHGNLIVGASNAAAYRKLIQVRSSEPLRIFIAHMDHPGFHGTHWISDTELAVEWHGGSPVEFLEGARVWTATAENGFGPAGEMTGAVLLPSGKALQKASVHLPPGTRSAHSDPTEIYGGFGFRQPVWQEGDLLYTKAADDLVGSFAVVSMALAEWKKKGGRRPPFLGLLTRAEEVGFIGAIAHFELGWLKKARREILCVSLETSRTLPGAEIGKGPVVRLGDRSTVFDSGALRVFSDLALKALPERHQRRIMDGGSCEATAATAYGFKSIGISVPLGNYHNQSFEGGPDSRGPMGPAPEFVHQGDVQGLLELCQALLAPRLPWATPWKSRQAEFKKSLVKYRGLLRSDCGPAPKEKRS